MRKTKAGASQARTFPYPPSPIPYPLLLLVLALAGCTVGPNYKRPTAAAPPAYKEQPPADFKEAQGWKPGQPADDRLKGKWWEIYKDPDLNALEEMVSINNQNVLVAEAQYREARDAVRIARAALFPTVGAGPSVTESRTAITANGANTVYAFPIDISYTVDLWGAIGRSVTGAAAQAQSSAANLENVRLLYQADLASDYFELHGTDGDVDLLQRTVKSYQEYMQLTRTRFAGGVASDLDVAQAEAQLYAAQTQLVDFGVARTQYEHAIAVLTGRPPAEVTVTGKLLTTPPPPVPIAVPSVLLERRPDIAINERLVAAANEQIGIAKAAYYPTLSLSGALGLESSHVTTWFSWPSRLFSVGSTLAETVFDAGRRRAQVNQTLAAYDSAVAAYRQTVLTAFQQVEDQLSTLRVLSNELVPVEDSVKSADRALTLSTAQYRAGTTSYLTVITAQAVALAAERTQIDLLTRRLTASVLLIQALGGGWDSTQLPSMNDVQAGTK
jgi:NodT family efflux transporter outer membrane factor (OMF) lipoprotein